MIQSMQKLVNKKYCNLAKKQLRWKPKYDFKKLVADMVKSDLEFVEKQGY